MLYFVSLCLFCNYQLVLPNVWGTFTFSHLYEVLELQCVFDTCSTSHFALPTLQVLNSHLWPGTILLDSAEIDGVLSWEGVRM